MIKMDKGKNLEVQSFPDDDNDDDVFSTMSLWPMQYDLSREEDCFTTSIIEEEEDEADENEYSSDIYSSNKSISDEPKVQDAPKDQKSVSETLFKSFTSKLSKIKMFMSPKKSDVDANDFTTTVEAESSEEDREEGDGDEEENTENKVSRNQWKCKHCTFLNPIKNRICEMCCKTKEEILEAMKSSEEEEDCEEPISSEIPKNDDEETLKKVLRRIKFEGNLPTVDQAEIALRLINDGYDQNDVYEIVNKASTLEKAKKLLEELLENRNQQQMMNKVIRKLLAENKCPNQRAALVTFKLIQEGFDEDLAAEVEQECGQLTTARSYLTRIMEMINRSEETKETYHQLWATNIVPSKRKAALVLELMDMGKGREEAIDAVQHCNTADEAMAYMESECEVCQEHSPPNEAFAMHSCEHTFCQNCAKQHFTIRIKDHVSLLDINCPICGMPDTKEAQDINYLNFLENQLRPILEEDIMKLFKKKIMELGLQNMLNFKWCRKCENGFIIDPQDRKVTCNLCGHEICAHCGMEWVPQHDNATCDEFLKWRDENKTENTTDFINNLLNENGIMCPQCQQRFELAKGGCMHFTCSQCGFQFCGGCKNEFREAKVCTFDADCVKKGLHAHHSRSCLYYLRDKSPDDLIKVLEERNIDFNDDTIINEQNDPQNPVCQVDLQKEINENNVLKLVDEKCGKKVSPRSGKLCGAHFVEYLVGLINKHSLDPIKIYDTGELEAELKRNKKQHLVPQKTNDPAKYHQDLIQIILNELPLD